MQGTVKKWNYDRGFGFIGRDGGDADLFCHVSALGGLAELKPGQRVEFNEELDARRGKFCATNVRVLIEGKVA